MMFVHCGNLSLICTISSGLTRRMLLHLLCFLLRLYSRQISMSSFRVVELVPKKVLKA